MLENRHITSQQWKDEPTLVETIRQLDADKKKSILKLIFAHRDHHDDEPQLLTDQEALNIYIDLDLNKSPYFYPRYLTNNKRKKMLLLPPY